MELQRFFFFFSSRRRHTRLQGDWSSDVCSSDLRTELERIEAVLAALDTLPVPDPGVDYGRRMWREIAPRLAEKPGRWWHGWAEAHRLAGAGVLVGLSVAAVVGGRITRPGKTSDRIAQKEKARERGWG